MARSCCSKASCSSCMKTFFSALFCCYCTPETSAKFLRFVTITSGLMLFAAPVFSFVMNVELVGKGGGIDKSLGSFAINTSLAAIGALIVAAEFHLSLIAKYFGFMACRAGRGTTLICTGLVLFAWARPTIAADESEISTSGILSTVAGVYAFVVGVSSVGLSMVCCESMALPPDSLSLYFHAIHESARIHKVKKNLSKAIETAGASTAREVMDDLEAGKAKPQKEAKKEVKKEKKPKKQSSVEVVAPAADNPFVNRKSEHAAPVLANPFMQPVSRC